MALTQAEETELLAILRERALLERLEELILSMRADLDNCRSERNAMLSRRLGLLGEALGALGA